MGMMQVYLEIRCLQGLVGFSSVKVQVLGMEVSHSHPWGGYSKELPRGWVEPMRGFVELLGETPIRQIS